MIQEMANDEEARSAILDQILKPVISSAQPSLVLGRSASFHQQENHTQTDIVRR